jgi:hypothetical protein
MNDHGAGAAQPLTAGMRTILYVASGLVFAVGISLYLLTEQTDVYFAWTIQSALTATFLGGAYWSACVLEFIAARRRLWAEARIAVPSVIIFTGLTLVVTLMHLDRFHFNAPSLLTRAGTWFWLAVYASVPIIMSVLLASQLRAPGGDPPRSAKPHRAIWFTQLAVGGLMVLCGVTMLVAPASVVPLWPWDLTPLTARAIGAWLVGLGFAACNAAYENDLVRIRPVMISSVIFSVLQGIALVRYPDQFRWGTAGGWIYLLFLVVFLAVGLYGWLATQQPRGRAAVAGQI